DAIRKSSTDLLRHVLEATLARGESGVSADEWEALQGIARDPAHRELPIDRAAELLVGALLATRFPDLADPEARRRMCERIAGSLCGDPTAMQRLKLFWHQLCESVA